MSVPVDDDFQTVGIGGAGDCLADLRVGKTLGFVGHSVE